jgi:hypothetical protein
VEGELNGKEIQQTVRTKVNPIPWSPKAALPIRPKHDLIEGSVRRTISVVHLTIPGSTFASFQPLGLRVTHSWVLNEHPRWPC